MRASVIAVQNSDLTTTNKSRIYICPNRLGLQLKRLKTKSSYLLRTEISGFIQIAAISE